VPGEMYATRDEFSTVTFDRRGANPSQQDAKPLTGHMAAKCGRNVWLQDRGLSRLFPMV